MCAWLLGLKAIGYVDMVMMVLKSLVFPVLAGGGVIALSWLLPPLKKWTWLGAWAFGLAISVAVFGSWIAENGVPRVPVESREQWIGILAFLAAIYAALAALTGSREFPVPQITAILAGGLVALTPLIDGWSGGKGRTMFADMEVADQVALGLAIGLGYLALLGVAERRKGITLPFSFAIAFTGLALLADDAGWISMTFAIAAAAGTAFIAGIVARFGGSPSIGRGGLLATCVLLTVLPVATYRQAYHEIPWWAILLVAGAPLVLLPLEIKVMEKMPPWSQALLRIVCVAILVGLGLVFGLSGGQAGDEMMSIYQ